MASIHIILVSNTATALKRAYRIHLQNVSFYGNQFVEIIIDRFGYGLLETSWRPKQGNFTY